MPPPIQRRAFLQAALLLSTPTNSLPPKKSGELDIHHIDTGRGNCTLIIGPDDTSIMIDAGASNSPLSESYPTRPDTSRRPGQWQAHYAQRHSAHRELDYLIATHIHPDHVGDVSRTTPLAKEGKYRLTGVTDVAAAMPIGVVIDRSFPDYGPSPPPTAPFAINYLNFLRSRIAQGLKVEKLEIGSNTQIRLTHNADAFPEFHVRGLAANGEVWNQPAAYHGPLSENLCSLALRLEYGPFSYFLGGDITAEIRDGEAPWPDLEAAITAAAGKTEVAAANHHGYFDACGPAFVRNLDARVYIIQTWHITHPGMAQLQRLLGAWSGLATHDVFATGILPINAAVNSRFLPLLKSRRGHVVIRVASGGAQYRIFVVDSNQQNGPILATVGPYMCRFLH